MKKYTLHIIVSMMLVAILALSAGAQHSHDGQKIHQAAVDGHELIYELIDIQQAIKEHSGNENNATTHHLMVYITDPQGDPATGAKVGFLIEGPQGEDQKVMAMGMEAGYGADISLAAKGKYTIKTKAVAGDQTVIYGFEYIVD